jgi:hypothetical protein
MSLANDPKHVIGNAVFAIETNLYTLNLRISMKQENMDNVKEVLTDIQRSLERIKNFLQHHSQ